MIQTERLILRRARLGDDEALHRVFSNSRAMRYWDSPPFEDIAQTRGLLGGMVKSAPPHSDDFVIELNGTCIGKAGCWRLDEVGIILHPDHWGQGYAKEALTATIPHHFQVLPIERLSADVDPRNTASLNLLTGLGFQETGRALKTILVGDQWCDSVYLELLRP